MAVPAAKYLVCFDRPEIVPLPEREQPAPVVAFQAPVFESDNAEQIEEAYRRGKEEGFASARSAFESELVEAHGRSEQELENARAQWMQATVEKLTEQIPAAFQTVEARIAESVSRVLKPAILAAVREDIIGSLTASLAKLRSGEGGRLVTITGPDALLEKLRMRLPEFESSIEFLPSQTVEVKAIADQTVLDSQIQAWSSALDPDGA